LGRRDSNHGEKDFRTHDEGLFGPVASVIRIDNEAAVIVATANESIFGLSGSVITHDTHEGSASPPRSRVVVFVNDNSLRSATSLRRREGESGGYGRELSDYGIKGFVKIKTIVVS
jgi:succinate-semialdehyde dehydrogenase / glutarate-semialdehyde dehydrogenase